MRLRYRAIRERKRVPTASELQINGTVGIPGRLLLAKIIRAT